MQEPLVRILYVEDDPDIQIVAKLALQTIGGFTLQVASSGSEALESVEAFRPQLILLDVMMPGMDGPATLDALRTRGVTVPVVFMTAKVQPQEVLHYRELGAVDVISKPFDPMALSDQVRDSWGKAAG